MLSSPPRSQGAPLSRAQPPKQKGPLSRLGTRLVRSRAVQAVFTWVLGRYIALVFHTTRWTYDGISGAEEHIVSGRRFIAFVWHNRLTLTPFAWRLPEHPLVALISDHRDGRLLGDVLAAARVGHIRVPANNMGQRSVQEDKRAKLAATREIQAAMRAGKTIGVAADGPKGPRLQVKMAALLLARVNNAEITIVTGAVKRRAVVKSWDRMVVPLPFNRGILRWGGKFYDPRIRDKNELEALRQEIEDDLNALTDAVDREMGHEPIPRA